MHHHRIAFHDVCGLGDLGETSCGVLTDTSTDGLKAYAQACGEEKALQQLTSQGVDTAKIKRLANGDVDWRDGASVVATYELGTNVDVRELIDDENNIRWDKVAETAGAAGAAAACAAYGAGAAAPVCGAVGGKLGAAIYKVGSVFVDVAGDMFGTTKILPILVPSPEQSVNLVAKFYLANLPGYLQGLAAIRGVALIAASTAQTLCAMLAEATGEQMAPSAMIRKLQKAGMSLPGGWTSLLRMPHSYDGMEAARKDDGGTWQVTTSELSLLHYVFGMNSSPFDAQGPGEIGAFIAGNDIDSQEDSREVQMFWVMATQGEPYVRFVSTSADGNDAPWPQGDLSWQPGDPAPSNCSLSTQNGGQGPKTPAADRYGNPVIYYNCFADGAMSGFPKGSYGFEVDVSYNDALRRLLVKPLDQQAQLRVAWLDSIRKAADVIRADIRIAKANKKLFVVNPSIFGNIFAQKSAPTPTWKKAVKYGAGAAVVAGAAWTAMRLFEKKPVVPPNVVAAVKKRVPW